MHTHISYNEKVNEKELQKVNESEMVIIDITNYELRTQIALS